MLRVVELIEKKRERQRLNTQEIRSLFQNFLAGQVPEYQMSALLMAIYFQGMERDELVSWTQEMISSGLALNFDHLPLPKVDKHSTGGVGDKISLPLAPLLAACDLLVPMMSGRGLGHTGGTLDKLESIKGFTTIQPPEILERLLREVGVGMIGQTEAIAPIDRELYALRDVTATVPSIPLIASSIMSKKIAEGTRNLILDVKVGRGAFMQTLEEGRQLAQACIDLGEGMGCTTRAMLTQMDQPLGVMIGNALEVKESIELLQGGGPEDCRTLVLQLAEELLEMTGKSRDLARQRLDDGSALQVFYKMVAAQGGDVEMVKSPSLLPMAPHRTPIYAPQNGYVTQLDARIVGDAAVILGAGRRVKSDEVDPRVGVELVAKIGDQVEAGSPLLWIHHDEHGLQEASDRLLSAYQFADKVPDDLPLIYEVLTHS
jgi:pyrimidine-nucleoside phosphorylase/thymidine phosphorylase